MFVVRRLGVSTTVHVHVCVLLSITAVGGNFHNKNLLLLLKKKVFQVDGGAVVVASGGPRVEGVR